MDRAIDCVLHPQHTYHEFEEWRKRQEDKCEVKIKHPRTIIKGKLYPNRTNDPEFPTFLAFFGIPYAEPPVGPLRFLPPQPLAPTTTIKTPVHRAYKAENSCLQYNQYEQKFEGAEDCLYLNIYLARKPKEMPKNMPVLVYIHGGGFQRGSGDISQVMPDWIVKQNIVFVTLNYRLDIFGFLNMGTDDCSGNAGLKDQVQALKWIRDNIKKFRGDPNNVTLCGHSAGGTCVNLHMISPLSRGLFHKAIVQAGGVHCPWGYEKDQEVMRRLFAQEYNVAHELRHVVVEALRQEDAYELLNITGRIVRDLFILNPHRLTVYCSPSLEKDTPDAFIPRDVEELMKTAESVPVIAGLTKTEGYMYLSVRCKDYPNGFDKLVKEDNEFVDYLEQCFNWNREIALKQIKTLRYWYFPEYEKMTSQEIQDHLAVFITDMWYRRFYDNFAIGDEEKRKPLYVYKFCYVADGDNVRRSDNGTKELHTAGPTHGDELNYLYDATHINQVEDEAIQQEMRTVTNHMCSMWANFCRTGEPKSNVEETLVWYPHTEKKPCFLKIDAKSTLVRSHIFGPHGQFLKSVIGADPSMNDSSTAAEQEFRFMQIGRHLLSSGIVQSN